MQFKSRIDEAVNSVFDFNVCLKTQCDSSNLNKHCGTYNTIFTERLPRILVYELQFLVEPPHKKKRMKSMQITSQFLFINRKFCQYVLMVHFILKQIMTSDFCKKFNTLFLSKKRSNNTTECPLYLANLL